MIQHFRTFITNKKILLPFILLLVLGITSIFCIFARANAGISKVEELPDPSFDQEDYEKLLALQFDGYENMTVSQYQSRVWKEIDTPAYRDLLDCFSKSDTFYQMRDQNPIASFYFYILEPLTAETWETRSFSGCAKTDSPDVSDQAVFEFVYSLTILDADTLTVQDYADARAATAKTLEQMLQDKTWQELQDDVLMQEFIASKVNALTEKWNSSKLCITVEYVFQPLNPDIGSETNGRPQVLQDQEPRRYPQGTPEDYRSLLELKTPDFSNMALSDFNQILLQWADEDHERMERIDEDTKRNEFPIELTDEERSFVTLTVFLSGRENGKYVQSNYTGTPEEDPIYSEDLPQKTAETATHSSWCSLYYQFSYHIPDKTVLTVGERDLMVGGLIEGIRSSWAYAEIDTLLDMEKEALVRELSKLAAQCSSPKLAFTISEDQVSFEKMKELRTTPSDNYTLLTSFKTSDYAQKTVADFNASLAPTPDDLSLLLEAYAQYTGTLPDEEDNEFFTVTLKASLNELYCEVFNEIPGYYITLSRKERPYLERTPFDETIYAFYFCAYGSLDYTIPDPEKLTVAQRDSTLLSFQSQLCAYVDSLSEADITASDFKANLKNKAAALSAALSTDEMQLSFDLAGIEISTDGEDIAP